MILHGVFWACVFPSQKKNGPRDADEADEVYEARALRARARRLADPESSDPDPSDLGRWGLPSTLPLEVDGVGRYFEGRPQDPCLVQEIEEHGASDRGGLEVPILEIYRDIPIDHHRSVISVGRT